MLYKFRTPFASIIRSTINCINKVASCWFIIYYRFVMHGNSNIKWCSLLLLGYKPVQHVTVLNTVRICNTMVGIIIL